MNTTTVDPKLAHNFAELNIVVIIKPKDMLAIPNNMYCSSIWGRV